MTKEEKELLLKDLCARLPYGIIIYRISDNSTHKSIHSDIAENIDMFSHFLEYSGIDDIKPHLRPMSSMSMKEKKEMIRNFSPTGIDLLSLPVINWLNSHYFDYRGLIEKSLALEAPKGMYNN